MALKGILSPNGNIRTWAEYLSTIEPGDFPGSIKQALYKSSEAERDRWVSVSTILRCLRKAKWEHEQEYYLPQEIAYYFMRGSLIHGILETVEAFDNSRADGVRFIEKDFSVIVPGTNSKLIGRIDRYENGVLYDYKTMSDQGIHRLLKEGPKEDHVWQVNMYKWMIEKNGFPVNDVVIVYVMMSNAAQSGSHVWVKDRKGNRTLQRINRVPIYTEEMILNNIVSKFKYLETYQEPPAKPEDWYCNNCYFRDKCNAIVGKGTASIEEVG